MFNPSETVTITTDKAQYVIKPAVQQDGQKKEIDLHHDHMDR